MSSLEIDLQKGLTPEIKKEFRKQCLLLNGYSDLNSWIYECDFTLDGEVYWSHLAFYGDRREVPMFKGVRSYFESEIKPRITQEELWEHIDPEHYDYITGTGWLYFEIYPMQNKLKIEMSYDYSDNEVREYEEKISDIIDVYKRNNDENTQIQLLKWEKQGAIFEVRYEGSEWNAYIDDSCGSNVGITKTPEIIEHLSEIMIETYESGYHLQDNGGEGTITIDFSLGTMSMEHIEYSKSSMEVELATLIF